MLSTKVRKKIDNFLFKNRNNWGAFTQKLKVQRNFLKMRKNTNLL